MSFPKKLYKYEAFSAQSLLNLKKQIIYFGSPLNFNDPYDCGLFPEITTPSDSDIEQIRHTYRMRPNLPSHVANELTNLSSVQLREKIITSGKKELQKQVDSFLHNRGVACFSECNDDLLMWAHYGGKYKGFCLEFDNESDDFKNAKPIKYTEDMPTVDIKRLLLNEETNIVDKLFMTKSNAWSYEREWRLIHEKSSTEYCYRPQSLTGVYFGPEVDSQAMEIVCLILAGQNKEVSFSKGHRSADKFKVEFEPFNYINHLDAKQHNLL